MLLEMSAAAKPLAPGRPVTPKARRTREALVAAGAAVAERDGLAGLNVAAVIAEAGVAKGTFYLYFADREGLIEAMHEEFYARVSAAVAAAVEGLPAGRDRLVAAVEAYLDVCLANRAVKALVSETRAQANLSTTMEDREALFARLAEPSLRAIGMTPANIMARLLVALTSEAALIEMEAGRRLPAARGAIGSLIDGAARA
jgi:AcrR family transcriptional regulator